MNKGENFVFVYELISKLFFDEWQMNGNDC